MIGNIGKENTFTSEIEDGYWIIKGTNNDYNQIWKKVADKDLNSKDNLVL